MFLWLMSEITSLPGLEALYGANTKLCFLSVFCAPQTPLSF